jgi:8-oxo-dGTP pyrophosphatase MutT (NUDIX family)
VPDLIDRLSERLTQPLPGKAAQERMTGRLRPLPEVIPPQARDSAVLQLLFPVRGEPHIVFIHRVEDGRAHSGQISFPGGRWEPQDASFQMTALREAEEEIGIVPAEMKVVGALTPLYIPVSYFMVHPFVAWSNQRPHFLPSAAEVSEVIEAPLAFLYDEANKIQATVQPSSMPGLTMEVPAYKLPDGRVVWGATAMMLAELEAVMQAG